MGSSNKKETKSLPVDSSSPIKKAARKKIGMARNTINPYNHKLLRNESGGSY